MKDKIIITGITILSVILTVALFIWWLTLDPTVSFTKSIPGMDRDSSRSYIIEETPVSIGEHFRYGIGLPSKHPGAWPQFRGADSDNICKDSIKLANVWHEDGPEVLWKIDTGEGHAAPVIKNGRVYFLDYDEEKEADALRCLSLDNGVEIWRRWYSVRIKRNHGISRTVPAICDGVVITIGPKCHVMCVDALSGNLKWTIDLVEEYGTKEPHWYTGQCPYIDNGIAVIAPVGTNTLMMGIDCKTGKMLWSVPNKRKWQMSHSSVALINYAGKRMYVYTAIGGMIGVSAEQGDMGRILWETDKWHKAVVAPTPLHLGNGRIFITAGYGAGSMVLQLTPKDDIFSVAVALEYSAREGLASEQQTPILYNGMVFGILPKDAGALKKQFVCYDPADVTRLLWSSGKTKRFGLGPYIVVDGKFYIMNDDGTLTMMSVSETGFDVLSESKVLDGHDAWGPIAIAGTRMLVRDSKHIVCINVGEQNHD